MVDPLAGVLGERAQREAVVAGDGQHADVGGPLARRVDDVRHDRVAEASEAEAEVERSAEHDDEIGPALQQTTRAKERQLVIGRQRAPPEPVEEARHPQVLDGGEQLRPRAVPVHVGADDERRPLGRRDQLRRARCTRASSGDVTDVVERIAAGDLTRRRAEHVEGEVEEDRAAMRRRRETGASNTIVPAVAGSVTVAADLVIDERIGTWSSSCNDPAPQRPCGARPPSTTSGDPLNHADVTAEMPFVIPGPAVSAASPGRRVSLA